MTGVISYLLNVKRIGLLTRNENNNVTLVIPDSDPFVTTLCKVLQASAFNIARINVKVQKFQT